MLPPSSPALTVPSAGSVLFSPSHLPLLAASFLPTFILSVSTRSQFIDRWTRGAVQNVYYVPCYLFSIPLIFWIIVDALHCPRDTLVTNGWLFRVDAFATRGGGTGTSWIYWREFDFSKVEWWTNFRKAQKCARDQSTYNDAPFRPNKGHDRLPYRLEKKLDTEKKNQRRSQHSWDVREEEPRGKKQDKGKECYKTCFEATTVRASERDGVGVLLTQYIREMVDRDALRDQLRCWELFPQFLQECLRHLDGKIRDSYHKAHSN
ncbi:uncharacterized protein BT62DRAFT_35260 [Guyanagaster necrorhizus]|uniref:Uncharacterized protein n=1 Tax=Guyanagaster necrorhizus TaxID=856835 RepID=A0A9P7W695_9AGAR|nr:uncharacterized protein BT62DRAFT_35260 [Guyanagaster necrorhizus MCA 3950]KAG7452918.1 hypothetical protein BT62DRAFT_35260 [Guyanagaster necrorhizus MCA 3950]